MVSMLWKSVNKDFDWHKCGNILTLVQVKLENKTARLPLRAPPLCARLAPLRRYANRCCAVNQAEQLQREQETLAVAGRLSLEKPEAKRSICLLCDLTFKYFHFFCWLLSLFLHLCEDVFLILLTWNDHWSRCLANDYCGGSRLVDYP